ncbi:MAG TPA: hypothetical protein VMV89_10655 [Candidatus Paceibacterota bacterium]|nr:hypothetical protein [Candidatus Paceibacterota bacterium]
MNVSGMTSVKNMAQEAMETIAETKAEAAKGDQQAIRNVAQRQVASHTQSAEPPVNTGNGSKDILNVKA